MNAAFVLRFLKFRPKPVSTTWFDFVIHGLGRRLSMLGELLGWNGLTYNPWLFDYFDSVARASAPTVCRVVRDQLLPASLVDVGAGSGAYAAEFQRLGLRVRACEWSARGRRLALDRGVDCVPLDLTLPEPAAITGIFDLACCFEVAEHLPEALGRSLVSYLTTLSDQVLFSAAHPGQGGSGHVNEQPKQYWIQQFDAHGFEVAQDATLRLVEDLKRARSPAWWLPLNCVVFRRRKLAPPTVVPPPRSS